MTITVVWQKAAKRDAHWEESLCLAVACHMVCLFPATTIHWIYPWCKQNLTPQLFIIQQASWANKWQTIISNRDALFTLSLWSHLQSNSLSNLVYCTKQDVVFFLPKNQIFIHLFFSFHFPYICRLRSTLNRLWIPGGCGHFLNHATQ